MLASLLIGVLTSLAVGVDRSLADALALVGAGEVGPQRGRPAHAQALESRGLAALRR